MQPPKGRFVLLGGPGGGRGGMPALPLGVLNPRGAPATEAPASERAERPRVPWWKYRPEYELSYDSKWAFSARHRSKLHLSARYFLMNSGGKRRV